MKNSVQKLMGFLVLICFSVSPAAFGAPVEANQKGAQIYKQTYIDLMSGKDALEVFNHFIASVKENKLTMKDVLEAAVQKGYMNQDQMNAMMDIAQKNTDLVNDKVVSKIKNNTLSKEDLDKLTSSIQGQIQGASYYCGRYGCFNRVLIIPIAAVIVLFLITVPVVVVVA